MLRPAGSQPPCFTCPKQSPAHASRFELSPRNQRLLAYYYEVRGSHGQAPLDELTRERFGWIEQILAEHERELLAKSIAQQLLPLVNHDV